MWLQLLFVLLAIIVGARVGGIGLGVFGGLGLAVLTFIFGLEPTTPPIDVMLMIVAVIAAAGCMQAAGGLDLMVKWAEKILRRHPQRITLLSPLVTYLLPSLPERGMWPIPYFRSLPKWLVKRVFVRNARWGLPSLLPSRLLLPALFLQLRWPC